MLKNGRPYSIENGSIDDKLITDRSENEIYKVMGWIKDNIRSDKKILRGHTSYGMKHLMEHDLGLYLTNNEFKDAMLLSGYKPVDPNELNWRYRILLTRYINDNPSPFFKWVKERYKADNSPKGDFARDMVSDFEFPTFAEHGVILNYLILNGACDEAVDVFERLWNEYKRKNNRTEICVCC